MFRFVLIFGLFAAPLSAGTVTVFAAASLKTALDAVATDWQAETGNRVVISYGASSALAKQIQQGAPADLFISAAENWMDVLEADGLLAPDTRRDLLGNSLVLIAAGRAEPVDLTQLPVLLGTAKLSMAEVTSVPAGQYGKEALTSLGLWDQVEAQVVQSADVRGALSLVATGEAPFGIVYATDAKAEQARVTVIATFPAGSHKAIIYPVALLATETPEAHAFLDALSGAKAAAIFAAQGFTPLP
ncbi:MAG: molybdate ABC transporter substrate-binding protein [Deltaproteobacteria bacterium]